MIVTRAAAALNAAGAAPATPCEACQRRTLSGRLGSAPRPEPRSGA